MITEYDLDSAIAECNGKRNPDAQTCMKLAAFYTIKEHMFGRQESTSIPASASEIPSYSYSGEPNTIRYESETAFGKAVSGMDSARIMPLIDEFVDTVRVLNPRLYDAFLRKISSI